MEFQRKVKEVIYFNAHRWVNIDIGREYRRMLREDRDGNSREAVRQGLVQLLEHCRQSVPYYADLMAARGDGYRQDPQGYLEQFPILTKETIKENFERLKSADIGQRKWRYNTSGGSTGEPARFIQDNAFLARSGAVQWLSHDWAGRRFGEPAVRVWGSSDDVLKNTMGWKMNLINYLTNDAWFNAFRMSPERMRACIHQLNARPPRLIIAYAQAIYELAQFAADEQLEVKPQQAILTSAGTLYPFMREKIESVFQCRVFNRYGSREVGDIACECEEHAGLHVFPWNNYIEIVDEEGQPVEAGVEGNILVTSLANYAMPLIRYQIGDRGILSQQVDCPCGRTGQTIDKISGRTTDVFVTSDGTLVDANFFSMQLFSHHWIYKYQVVQKSPSAIIYRIIRSKTKETPNELDEIIQKTKHIMGVDCSVTFEFVEDLPPSPSGKFLYLISEVRS